MRRPALALFFGAVTAVGSGCGRSDLWLLEQSVAGDAGSTDESGGFSGSSSGSVAPSCSPAPGLAAIASGQSHPESIAVDATSVYFTADTGVMKVSKCGGPVTTLVPGIEGGGSLAVDQRNVYFLQNQYGANARVASVARGGGPVVTLAAAPFAQALTIDATSAYWVSDPMDGTADGAVMRLPLEGGTPTTLASGQVSPLDIAVAGGNVYWTSADGKTSLGYGGEVMTAPVGGGMPGVFGHQSEADLAANSTRVFWQATDDYWMGSTFVALAAVETEPLAGGAEVTLASVSAKTAGLGDLVADDSSLYYSAYRSNIGPIGIVKLPLAGGAAPTTITSGVGQVSAIALDDTSLYWLNDEGSVMRLTPK